MGLEKLNRVLLVDVTGRYMGELLLPAVAPELRLEVHDGGRLSDRAIHRFVRAETNRPGHGSLLFYVETP